MYQKKNEPRREKKNPELRLAQKWFSRGELRSSRGTGIWSHTGPQGQDTAAAQETLTVPERRPDRFSHGHSHSSEGSQTVSPNSSHCRSLAEHQGAAQLLVFVGSRQWSGRIAPLAGSHGVRTPGMQSLGMGGCVPPSSRSFGNAQCTTQMRL